MLPSLPSGANALQALEKIHLHALIAHLGQSEIDLNRKFDWKQRHPTTCRVTLP